MDTNARQTRRRRIRARISGTAERPRVSVHRSARAVWVQMIDDTAGRTLAAGRSELKKDQKKIEAAKVLGENIAKQVMAAGIKKAVFDRSGYKYHGRVRAIAEGLRAGGIEV